MFDMSTPEAACFLFTSRFGIPVVENNGTKNGKAKGPVDPVDEEKKKRRQERCRASRKLLFLVVADIRNIA